LKIGKQFRSSVRSLAVRHSYWVFLYQV